MLKEKLGLPTDPPTKYVLLNRPPKKSRRIANFEEFTKEVKEKLPQYPWEIFPDPFPSFAEAAR